MHRSIRLIPSALLGLCLFSCRGCGEPAWPATALELVSADAAVVVSMPEFGATLASLNGFVGRATRQAGSEALQRSRDNLKKQLGFDPLAVADYEASGIDVGSSVMLFTEGADRELLLAVPVKDREILDQRLRALIEKTDGANRFTEARLHDFATVTAGRPFGDEVVPAFHWAFVGRYLLVVRDSGRGAWEKALVRLAAAKIAKTPTPSLRQEPVYLRLARKVPPASLQIFVRSQAVPTEASRPGR